MDGRREKELANGVARVLASDFFSPGFLSSDPRLLFATCLWGPSRVAEATARYNNTKHLASSAPVSRHFVTGSVEAAGSGMVLVRSLQVDLRWSIDELRHNVSLRISSSRYAGKLSFVVDSRCARFFLGHGGPELVDAPRDTHATRAENSSAASTPAVRSAEDNATPARGHLLTPRPTSCHKISTASLACVRNGFVFVLSQSSLSLSPGWESKIKSNTAKFKCPPGFSGVGKCILLSLSRDGRTLASAHGQSKMICFWNTETGEAIHDVMVLRSSDSMRDHSRPILDLCFSNDGKMLAVAMSRINGQVGFICATPDKVPSLWQTAMPGISIAGEAALLSVTFAGQGGAGKLVAACLDGSVRVYSRSGTQLRTVRTCATDGVQSVAMSPDSSLLVTATIFGQVFVSNFESGEILFPNNNGPNWYKGPSIRKTNNELHLAGQVQDIGTVAIESLKGDLLNATRKTVLCTDGPVSHVIIADEGTRIWAATMQSELYCWDSCTGNILYCYRLRQASITSMSQGGGRVAVGLKGSCVIFFNSSSGTLEGTCTGLTPFTDVDGNESFVSDLVLSPDGQYLVSCFVDDSGESRPWMYKVAVLIY
eukprot:INCI10690.1.p1 GENE.INCI10690.1~~INCI10690.1.p1  ORF type:complete len:597 (-),score=79.54 INCI10690.1:898-2688(-)